MGLKTAWHCYCDILIETLTLQSNYLNIPFWCFSNCQQSAPYSQKTASLPIHNENWAVGGDPYPFHVRTDIPAPTPSRCTKRSAAGPSSRIWSLHLGSRFYPLKSKDFFLKSLLGNISSLPLFQGSFSSTFEHVRGSQLKKKKIPTTPPHSSSLNPNLPFTPQLLAFWLLPSAMTKIPLKLYLTSSLSSVWNYSVSLPWLNL